MLTKNKQRADTCHKVNVTTRQMSQHDNHQWVTSFTGLSVAHVYWSTDLDSQCTHILLCAFKFEIA